MAVTIERVLEGSIAEELGLEAGDSITHMCGEAVVDIIDYLFFEALEELTLTVTDGENTLELELEKDGEEPLGLLFVGDGLGPNRGCANNCLFCFVDQLPEGMRQSLYFKDDDWRLSFIMGNYVTLTNVSDREFDRILARKVSPLYISVHAADDDVRAQLLNCERGRGLMPRLRRLKEAGICFHAQAVICGGLNDGAVLDRTIAELSQLMPNALSLALVPVGLTTHRDRLYPLRMLGQGEARAAIAIAHKWQKRLLQSYGTRFVHVADEFYIRANMPFPPLENYEELGQLEDGVGLVALFRHEVQEALAGLDENKTASEVQAVSKPASIATGVDAAPYIRAAAEACMERGAGRVSVYPITNHHFGETITITGLLTGRDIINGLQGKDLGDCLYLCSVMLRDGNGRFLDDMTVCEVQEALGVRVEIIEPDGGSFVKALLGSTQAR